MHVKPIQKLQIIVSVYLSKIKTVVTIKTLFSYFIKNRLNHLISIYVTYLKSLSKKNENINNKLSVNINNYFNDKIFQCE